MKLLAPVKDFLMRVKKKKKTSVLNLSVCCCLITQLLFLGIAVFPVFRITNNFFLGHWDSVVSMQ